MGDEEQTTPGQEVEANKRFADAGEKPGLEIWRIEQFEPVRRPESTHGTFYTGDCYLVLDTKVRPGANKLDYDLHFWLGKQSTQDESGAAAMLTVELDELGLDGSAVQHRETQGHESKLFMSYFKKNFRYLEGGVASGFHTVDPDAFTKRLFQIKGRKNVRVAQVDCHCASLNQGDTFVLDDGKHIYVWIGPKTGKKERSTGMSVARMIRDDDRGGQAHIHVVEDWNTNEEFFKALGSKDKVIRAANETDDDDVIRRLDQQVLFYEVEDKEDGVVSMFEVQPRPLQQSMLDSNRCYLLDGGATGIFTWTGKAAPYEFKKKVWNGVNLYLSERGYPSWVQVTRVVDGGETPLFKQYFKSWEDPAAAQEKQEEPESNVAEQDYSGADGVDIEALHKAPAKTTEWMPDDGSGKVEVYRVDGNKLAKVPEKAHGVFFGEDSYVILYTYEQKERDNYIVYFWQGSKCPLGEKGTSAAYAVAVDQKLGGDAVQIRVVMQKEPAHFMKIFGGKVVYFMAGHVSGFRNMHDHDMYDPSAVYMFQVRADSNDNTRAMQVVARGASLNSNDIFIVDSPKRTFAWCGKFASEPEIELGTQMLEYIAKKKGDPIILEEGHETGQFWGDLGGEEAYSQAKRTSSRSQDIQARLFQCSMSSGRFVVEQIIGFIQDDLDEDDVMILDTYEEVFIWLGSKCKEFEKKEAYKTAYQYLSTDPSSRSPENTMIVVVRQGFEPPQFTGAFQGWDANMWSEGKTFQEMVAEVGEENAGIALLEDEVQKYTAFYTLEELQRTVPPEGVNVMQKEMHLCEEEFQEVFKMTKDEFRTTPEWKRNNLKKQYKLF